MSNKIDPFFPDLFSYADLMGFRREITINNIYPYMESVQFSQFDGNDPFDQGGNNGKITQDQIPMKTMMG